MQVGDLVRLVNEWQGHNPWMKFPDEQPKIGLIVGVAYNRVAFRVWVEGTEFLIPPHRLEVLNANR